jgi:hypothetical protein
MLKHRLRTFDLTDTGYFRESIESTIRVALRIALAAQYLALKLRNPDNI